MGKTTKMKKQFLFLSALLVLFTGNFRAQQPAVVINDQKGWHKIAETKVSFEKETDEVEVLLADKFASLKFKVTDAPIDLRELMVYFDDGSEQKITIGSHLKKAGESSREIDLRGQEEKDIKRIVLSYNTVKTHRGKKAHMEIWGKKTNADKADQGKKSEKMEHQGHDEHK